MESRLRHFVQIMVGSIHLMISRNFWCPLDASMRSLLPIHRSRMEWQRGSIGQLLGKQRQCCMGLNFLSFCGLKKRGLQFIV